MYKKLLIGLAFALALPVHAAQTKNTMKMVTYFPIPYVAYDTVVANDSMEIGGLNSIKKYSFLSLIIDYIWLLPDYFVFIQHKPYYSIKQAGDYRTCKI